MSQNVRPSRIPVFSLGERIRKVRDDLGLSQQQFADLLGINRKTLNNWEGNRNHPRYGDLMLIASVADVSLEWLAAEEFRPTSVAGGVSGDISRVTSQSSRQYSTSPRPDYAFDGNFVVSDELAAVA